MGQSSEHAATTLEDWTRSDLYHNSFLIPRDDALASALARSAEGGLPEIAVSEAQGKYLQLVARTIGARRILEVGTLGGYSTIFLARALPEGGELITLEIDPHHAEVATKNVEYAGLASKVKVIVGPAAESLEKLTPDPPFDFAFIDADKPSNTIYFKHATRLVRKGGVIIVDNVVRNGDVAILEKTNDSVEGVRSLLEHLKTDTSVEATTIATVGQKGYDGFLYALRV